MFVAIWWVLVALVFIITCVNGYFIGRLSTVHPEVYRDVGRPTAFFFATGGWLTSRRFTRFLLTGEASQALRNQPALLRIARAIGVLYILLLACLLIGLVSLFV